MHFSVDKLVNAYHRIGKQRMQGLPIFNPCLEVEAVGFTQWEGRLLGVLITPWFMNLIILPSAQDDWSELKSGASETWDLPAGEYEFTVTTDEAAGVHQSLSLFTTVTDFPDQHTARAVAQEIMDRIFIRDVERKVNPVESVNDLPAKILHKPMSRRDLLRRFIPGEK